MKGRDAASRQGLVSLAAAGCAMLVPNCFTRKTKHPCGRLPQGCQDHWPVRTRVHRRVVARSVLLS